MPPYYVGACAILTTNGCGYTLDTDQRKENPMTRRLITQTAPTGPNGMDPVRKSLRRQEDLIADFLSIIKRQQLEIIRLKHELAVLRAAATVTHSRCSSDARIPS